VRIIMCVITFFVIKVSGKKILTL